MDGDSIDSTIYTGDLEKSEEKRFRIKTIIVFLEISLIVTLILLWVSSESIRESKNIWIFFFYNFPSQFLISFLPHEPVLIYYSKFYSVLYITFVAIVGTILTEWINYYVFEYFSDLKMFKKIRTSKSVGYLINLFNKAPFTALLIAGFSPVPFYPFRFLVVLASYPLLKYLLAVFFSRTPRFFLLALFGKVLNLPDGLIVGIFFAIGVIIYIPIVKEYLEKRRLKKTSG